MQFLEHNLLTGNREVAAVIRHEDDFFAGCDIVAIPIAHHIYRSAQEGWIWSDGSRRQWVMDSNYPYLIRFTDGTYGLVQRDSIARAMTVLNRTVTV